MLDNNNNEKSKKTTTEVKNLFNKLASAINAQTIVSVASTLKNVAKQVSSYIADLIEKAIKIAEEKLFQENQKEISMRAAIEQKNNELEKQAREHQLEIERLQEITKKLEANNYKNLETLSNNYAAEKEEERKKSEALRQSIENNLKNNLPISQKELDKQLKTPDQIKKEKETVAKIREEHKTITDHGKVLNNEITKLQERLKQPNLSKEQHKIIEGQLKTLKDEQIKHFELQKKADGHVQKVDVARKNKEKETGVSHLAKLLIS